MRVYSDNYFGKKSDRYKEFSTGKETSWNDSKKNVNNNENINSNDNQTLKGSFRNKGNGSAKTSVNNNLKREDSARKESAISQVNKMKAAKRHDKAVVKEWKTDIGGGANISSRFNDDGKLITDIKLSAGKDRTDNKGFLNKSITFMDTASEVFNDVKPVHNEAGASNIDEKLATFIDYSAGRHNRKADRYKDIRKAATKEIVQLRKEEKKENKQNRENGINDNGYSDTRFSSNDKGEFVDTVDAKFDVADNSGETSNLNALVMEGKRTEKSVNERFKKSNGDFKRNDASFSDYVEQNFRTNEIANKQMGLFQTDTKGSSVSELKKQTASTALSGKMALFSETKTKADNKKSKSKDKSFDEVDNKNSKRYRNDSAVLDSKYESENLTRQEKFEQKKSVKESAKKSESKEVKKAAVMTEVSNMLMTKKHIQNQLGDMSGNTSGDLIKDGSGGMVQAFIERNIEQIKKMVREAIRKLAMQVMAKLQAMLAFILASIMPVFGPVLILILLIVTIGTLCGTIMGVFGGDLGANYSIDGITGDGYAFTSLSEEEIVEIMASVSSEYEVSSTVKHAIEYSLSKVGCEYNQAYHNNMNVDIFDCSSLVYRAYDWVGVNIAGLGGSFTAAAECYYLTDSGCLVEGELQPGDLIFYGGSDNGRYLGIYHVAIYVGKVNGIDKMVEARGTEYGVIYCDVRTNNVVSVCRPG